MHDHTGKLIFYQYLWRLEFCLHLCGHGYWLNTQSSSESKCEIEFKAMLLDSAYIYLEETERCR